MNKSVQNIGDANNGGASDPSPSSPLTAFANTVTTLVAVGWLVIPALQYFGSVQRTQLLITGSAQFPSLAGLDLTIWYTLLLGMTALIALFHAVANRLARVL